MTQWTINGRYGQNGLTWTIGIAHFILITYYGNSQKKFIEDFKKIT